LLGAVVVPLNTRYKEHELRYLITQSDVSVLVVAERLGGIDFMSTLRAVFPHLRPGREAEASAAFPQLRHIVVDEPHIAHHGTSSLQVHLANGDAVADEALLDRISADVQLDDPFTILYTSGTTAAPKGAIVTHRNTVPHGWFCGEISGVDASSRVLLQVPLSGSWGGLCISGMAFARGARLVLTAGFDATETLKLIERERVTFWPAVDAMAMAVMDHPDFARHDHSSLRGGWFVMNTGGRDGLFEEIVRVLGARQAFQPYGMSEINCVVLYHELDEPVTALAEPGGFPAEGIEVRLVDVETQRPIDGVGQGEMQFRGTRVTPGYYNKPEETAAAFTTEGWFRSGDLGRRNEAGRVIFLTRLREALRINHFMVSPREIEECIMELPGVHQCFVVGVPDASLGEVVGAYVIPNAGGDCTAGDIVAHCKQQLASYKVPVHIRIVLDVPRTPGPHGDKAQKGKLKQMLIDELSQGVPT
jgi:fatty-acyl-CoA synthase